MTAKDLKNALLQEAVQGKLVPQIASEGNARDLLEEIRKKRGESLPLATARKRSSATPSAGTPRNAPMEITEDEIPFDIPESWCWCRLGELIAFTDAGKSPLCQNRPRVDDEWGVIKTTAVQDKFFIEEENKVLSTNFKLDKSMQIHKNDLLITRAGPRQRTGILCLVEKEPKNLILSDKTVRLNYFSEIVNPYFLMNALSAPAMQNDIEQYMTGMAASQVNISQENMKKFLIPLPPLAEQKRIVAAIEKFMPLIEEYGQKETVLNELNAQIGTLTKKAILQEAVQGKLVPQIPFEGNAKDLLEQIKAQKPALIKDGKIKKDKALPEITEDEIPFDIPENWCWCRLGEVVPFGQCSNAEPSEIEPDAWVLDLEDIEKDSGKILSYKTMKESDSKSTKHIFKKDYVLYSKLRPYLNKCVIATQDGYCTSEILPLNFGKYIYNKYAQLYLMSPFFVDYTNSLSFGVKMPRLGTEDGKKALFPLPPLSEQKRIVEAIEKMLPMCEKLGK